MKQDALLFLIVVWILSTKSALVVWFPSALGGVYEIAHVIIIYKANKGVSRDKYNKSLMKMVKSIGPMPCPCGTPTVTLHRPQRYRKHEGCIIYMGVHLS